MGGLGMQSIFIAGAEGHLGRHTVLHFLNQGYRVFGSAWKTAMVTELTEWVRAQCGRQAPFEAFPTSLSAESEVQALALKLQTQDPTLRKVVNCAGGFEWVKLADSTFQQAQFLMDANFYSNWALLKHWMPFLSKAKQGRVVVISAAVSTKPAGAGMGLYVGSKAALNALVDSANEEYAQTGARVRAVFPTIIDTPRNRADMPSADFSTWMTPAQVAKQIEENLA
jgi:NAD(P)-dependent dehydrogenase (short-subunit alcohol dehydrogenase family)